MSQGDYWPILRPRRGEFAALHHLDPASARRVTPIFEVDAQTNLAHLVRSLPPRTAAIAVDFGNVPDSPDPLDSPLLDLAEGSCAARACSPSASIS